jgi:AraC-like DNA-binding protein
MLRRKSVFVTILISYCLLLVIPLAAGWGGYRIMENALTRNVNQANFGMLEQVQLTVDGRLRELDRMMLQLAMNTDVQWLLHNAESDYGIVQMRSISLMKSMSALLNVSDFFDSAFISFGERDMVLTPTAQTGHDLYFKRIQQFGQSGELRKLLAERNYKSFLPAVEVMDNGSMKTMLAYVQSLPLDETANPKGSIVFLVDEQKVIELLKRVEWNGNSLNYVLDQDGKVIVSTPERGEPAADIRARLSSGHDSFSLEHEGTSMMVSFTTGENGWKYVSVVPKDIVMSPIRRVKSLFLQLFCFGAAAGLAVSCILAYRNYKPVRDMIRVITGRRSGSDADSMNEYDYIRSALIRSFEEESALKQTIEMQAPIIRANFLSRLIKGNVDVSVLDRESLEFMQVKLDYRTYRVVLIDIEDGRKFMKTETEREWALLRFIVANLSGELLQGNGFVVELERNRIAVLEFGAEDGSDDAWIVELKRAVEERFRMTVAIAVSPTRDKPEHIWRCYSDALLALDRRMLQGTNDILYHADPASAKRSIYRYPPELEVQLINYAKTGEYEKAAGLLGQIVDDNLTDGQLSPEMGRFLFIDILGSLLRAMHASDAGQTPPEGLGDPIAYFADCSTAEQMLERLKRTLGEICASAKGARTDQGERLYAGIVKLIGEQYGNGNLSLTLIADHLGITPQYCSAFFKKYGGGNISDYIAEYRIAQAKTMLAGTRLTIGDISRKVGYANHIGFGRVFKKIEGITPGQYRDMVEREKTSEPAASP